jgi:uncharacterized protein YkwD
MTLNAISAWFWKFPWHKSSQRLLAANGRGGRCAVLARAVAADARWWPMEALEARTLLSGLTPSNYEQYMVQLVNFARSDPAAYATSLGVTLNEGLPAGTITANPKQPLAINTALVQSAANHSQWMLDTDTFSHTGAGGSNPGSRMAAAGYVFTGNWTWGENIAWSGSTPSVPNVATTTKQLEQNLFTDLDVVGRGHRINLMNDDFREVGVGIRTGTFEGYNAVMITQDFAASGYNVFLTGAVYDDSLVQRNSFYNPGEGLGGITITATSGINSYQTTTWSSGGYRLALPAGTWHVVAHGGTFSGTAACDVTLSSSNVEADFLSGLPSASVNFQAPALAATGTALVTSRDIITYGNSVTLTATVTGSGTPTGSVTFYDGNTSIGTANVASATGVATLTRSNFTAGSHSLTAAYTGNSSYSASTSGAVVLTVNKANLTVTTDAQSKTYGQINPVLTGSLSGVLAGDSITATYTTSASTFSHPGNYFVSATLHDPLGKLNNYNVITNRGVLSITKAAQTIAWATPASISFGTPLSALQLNAAVTGVAGGSDAGALTYEPALGAMLDVGSQTLTVTADPTTDYNGATKSVTLVVTRPDKPVNIAPANGAAGVSLTPALAVSPYSIPIGATEAASQWLVTRVADGVLVWDSGADTADMLSTSVPADLLTYDTSYSWQFRFQDTDGLWSDYSTATTFTTWDPPPGTPVNALPADSTTGVSVTPALSASPFAALDTDTHVASRWVVNRASDGAFVWDSGTTGADLTTITIPAGALAYDTVYRWKVSYLDSGGLWSSFSTFTTFRTTAAHLAVVQQPRGVITGAPNATELIVAVVDDSNAVITADSSTIVVSATAKPRSGVLSGTTAVAAVNGVARFSNLLFSSVGTYTLQAASGTLTTISTSALSATLPPARLAFAQRPITTIAGQFITSTTTGAPVVVSVVDAGGRVVVADNSSVTLSLSQLAGTLNGTLTVPVIDGIAAFYDLNITKSGKYSIKAADGLLKAAVSRTFTVTPDLATTHLAWAQQPAATTLVGKSLAPRLIVQAVDQFDNVVTAERSTILLTCTTGTFSGASAARLSRGKASFSNVVFRTAGDYTLLAAPATTSTLAITTPLSVDVAIAQGTTNPIPTPGLKTAYTFGKSLTFTVKLTANTPSSIPFTGTPALVIAGAADLNLPAVSFSTSGKATFTVPVLHPGAYTCQIVYDGDVNHSSATSLPFSFTVHQAATTTILSATPTTSLAAGQTVTLTAVVKSSAAPAIAREGSLQILDNGVAIQTVALNASSSATIVLTPTSTGSHVYQAVYLGNPDFTTSGSPLLTRVIR